ncbi:hypothetical protein TIFTF001_026879 [Ficus carica]|uniref:Uncharacterized protein n=1 Tax=Ficus carica TaxID=3494 RepID=A0AA88DLY9_FICCA|nr:hypothetical protein TIFTF001_026879 [Ficus carica]
MSYQVINNSATWSTPNAWLDVTDVSAPELDDVNFKKATYRLGIGRLDLEARLSRASARNNYLVLFICNIISTIPEIDSDHQ